MTKFLMISLSQIVNTTHLKHCTYTVWNFEAHEKHQPMMWKFSWQEKGQVQITSWGSGSSFIQLELDEY